MDVHFIHAKSNEDITLPVEAIKQLPKIVGIVTTIQHKHKLPDVLAQLPHAVLGGQVLGCRADHAKRIKDKVDAFLYIGSGRFHPIQVALETNKNVFCWNPFTKTLTPLDKNTIQDYKKRVKVSLMKFFSAKKVGILLSTKLGQNDNKINKYTLELKMKKANQLLARKDKDYYLFAFDTLTPTDMEHFNFIDCWINTACSRIADAKTNIVNVDDIFGFEKLTTISR
jgi:2-(3-amino-3-carboxypropyl)histidine synthase